MRVPKPTVAALVVVMAFVMCFLFQRSFRKMENTIRRNEDDYAAGNLQKDLVSLAKANGMGGDITIVTPDGIKHLIKGKDYI